MQVRGMSSGAPPRNAPCPCGSGRRYKDCHGRLTSSAVEEAAARARAQLAAGARDAASDTCNEALSSAPEHPELLRILSHCVYEEGRPAAGLELALRSVRALGKTPLPASVAFGAWSTLNFMFTQALAGLGTDVAAAQRAAYHHWLDAVVDITPGAGGAVSTILVLRAEFDAAACEATLDSLAKQSLRPAEVVVVGVGNVAVSPSLQERLAALPFPFRLVEGSHAGYPAAVNAGAAECRGDWLAILELPHALAPSHLQSLVAALRAHRAEWGFSACSWEPSARAGHQSDTARAATGASLQQSIAETDTVGFAFINQEFVAIGDGAMLFARGLFERLGGMRELPACAGWDLALRALWCAEPWYTGLATYRHRSDGNGAAPDRADSKRRRCGSSTITTPVPAMKRRCRKTSLPRRSRAGD